MIKEVYILGFNKAAEEVLSALPPANPKEATKKALANAIVGSAIGTALTGIVEGKKAISPGNLKSTFTKILASGATPYAATKLLEGVNKIDKSEEKIGV